MKPTANNLFHHLYRNQKTYLAKINSFRQQQTAAASSSNKLCHCFVVEQKKTKILQNYWWNLLRNLIFKINFIKQFSVNKIMKKKIKKSLKLKWKIIINKQNRTSYNHSVRAITTSTILYGGVKLNWKFWQKKKLEFFQVLNTLTVDYVYCSRFFSITSERIGASVQEH